MSTGFQAVQWNKAKYRYDAIMIAAVAIYLLGFMWIGATSNPPRDAPAWIDLRIRAFGTCAFLMLTVILCIGPLARLKPKFLPLLYNRRHFGVLFFFWSPAFMWHPCCSGSPCKTRFQVSRKN